MNITLFDYQDRIEAGILNAWKAGTKWLMCVLPTGGGKTVIFCDMIKKSIAKKAGFCTVLVHRSELAKQTVITLNNMEVSAAMIGQKGTYEYINGAFEVTKKNVKDGFDCYVCMEGTLNARINKGYQTYLNLLLSPNILFVDEAHFTHFAKLLKRVDRDKQYVCQFTATPLFSNKKLKISDYYDAFVQGPQPLELIAKGRLVPPVYYEHEIDETELKLKGGEYTDESVIKTYEQGSILESVLYNYNTHQKGEKTLLFTVSIEFAKHVTEYLVENGVNARCIDSENCKEDERAEIFDWMHKTEDAFLVNVGIATTGTDIPTVRSIILLRVVGSLGLYIQIVGRGGRTYEGKDHFKFFDYGNNRKRHGDWEADRDWEAIIEEHEKPKKKKKSETFGLKVVSIPSLSLFLEEDDFSAKFGDKTGLVILSPSGQENPNLAYLKSKPWKEMSLDELIVYQKLTSKKAGWLYRQVFSRHGEEGLRAFFKIIGYSGEWTETIIARYLAE